MRRPVKVPGPGSKHSESTQKALRVQSDSAILSDLKILRLVVLVAEIGGYLGMILGVSIIDLETFSKNYAVPVMHAMRRLLLNK